MSDVRAVNGGRAVEGVNLSSLKWRKTGQHGQQRDHFVNQQNPGREIATKDSGECGLSLR